jgi:hypothetical protein
VEGVWGGLLVLKIVPKVGYVESRAEVKHLTKRVSQDEMSPRKGS